MRKTESSLYCSPPSTSALPGSELWRSDSGWREERRDKEATYKENAALKMWRGYCRKNNNDDIPKYCSSVWNVHEVIKPAQVAVVKSTHRKLTHSCTHNRDTRDNSVFEIPFNKLDFTISKKPLIMYNTIALFWIPSTKHSYFFSCFARKAYISRLFTSFMPAGEICKICGYMCSHNGDHKKNRTGQRLSSPSKDIIFCWCPKIAFQSDPLNHFSYL